jgi:calcineurin-like phosphoesterase family protein
MYWFTADEHFSHGNIIQYCNRPFNSVYEMNETLIRNHNEVVKSDDIVIHGGDFSFVNRYELANKIIERLNGSLHIFLKGSHDKWLKVNAHDMWERNIDGQVVVVCHYAMLVWPKSHYGSWQLYGHSHGKLDIPIMGKQYDIGVDNNNFYPVSFDKIVEIMKGKKDNFNLLRKANGKE